MSSPRQVSGVLWGDDGPHTWNQEEEECTVRSMTGNPPHTHFMCCGVCGIRRRAYAEPGCYHYFQFDHPNGKGSAIVPPCQGNAGEGNTVVNIDVCGRCGHMLEDGKRTCHCDPETPIVTLQGCSVQRHTP